MIKDLLLEELKALGLEHEWQWIAEFCEQKKITVESVVLRRKQGEPLAYIFGSWAFRAHEFFVGPGVLIPRPETEELVELVLKHCMVMSANLGRSLHVADLGAGSGCIGLSILHEADAFVESCVLVERSSEASIYLEKNANHLLREEFFKKEKGKVPRLQFYQGDWNSWAEGQSAESLDVMVSNPPYVSQAEFAQLDDGVKKHEPTSALVHERALRDFTKTHQAYEDILKVAPRLLRPGGELWFELGVAQMPWIDSYARTLSWVETVEFHKDMSGKNRFVRITKQSIA